MQRKLSVHEDRANAVMHIMTRREYQNWPSDFWHFPFYGFLDEGVLHINDESGYGKEKRIIPYITTLIFDNDLSRLNIIPAKHFIWQTLIPIDWALSLSGAFIKSYKSGIGSHETAPVLHQTWVFPTSVYLITWALSYFHDLVGSCLSQWRNQYLGSIFLLYTTGNRGK